MELVDTHCHLSFPPLLERLPQVLKRAMGHGVHDVIVPSFDGASWPVIADLTARQGVVYGAFGLHPWVADEAFSIEELALLLERERTVALGEIGLDFSSGLPARERQTEVLHTQLQLARDLDLPVILHCRKAFEEMIGMLKIYSPGLRGVIHAYSRGPELAGVFLDLGLQIAFGGAITRPNAKRAMLSATAVPLERIVLETDAPSIGLEGVAPQDVEPSHVAQVAQQLARLRGQPLERVAQETTDNARALFRIG